MIGVRRDLLLFDLWTRDPVGGCFGHGHFLWISVLSKSHRNRPQAHNSSDRSLLVFSSTLVLLFAGDNSCHTWFLNRNKQGQRTCSVAPAICDLGCCFYIVSASIITVWLYQPVILERQVVHHSICFKPQSFLLASWILISAADKRPDGGISCVNAPLPSLNWKINFREINLSIERNAILRQNQTTDSNYTFTSYCTETSSTMVIILIKPSLSYHKWQQVELGHNLLR